MSSEAYEVVLRDYEVALREERGLSMQLRKELESAYEQQQRDRAEVAQLATATAALEAQLEGARKHVAALQTSVPYVIQSTCPHPHTGTEHPDTRRLINQLYHDNARLERVVADAVDLAGTVSYRLESGQQLTGTEHDEWLLGLLRQFIDTHEQRS